MKIQPVLAECPECPTYDEYAIKDRFKRVEKAIDHVRKEFGEVIDDIEARIYRWYRASASGLDPEGEARHMIHQTLSNHVPFYVVTTRNKPLKVWS